MAKLVQIELQTCEFSVFEPDMNAIERQGILRDNSICLKDVFETHVRRQLSAALIYFKELATKVIVRPAKPLNLLRGTSAKWEGGKW